MSREADRKPGEAAEWQGRRDQRLHGEAQHPAEGSAGTVYSEIREGIHLELYCIIVSLQGGPKKEERAEGGDAKSGGVLVANWRKETSLTSSVFWPSDVILNAPFLIFLDELSPAYIVYRL